MSKMWGLAASIVLSLGAFSLNGTASAMDTMRPPQAPPPAPPASGGGVPQAMRVSPTAPVMGLGSVIAVSADARVASGKPQATQQAPAKSFQQLN